MGETMKAGREMDALIAEKVFGWRRITGPTTDYDGPCEHGDVLIPPTMTRDEAYSAFPPRGAIPFAYFVTWRYSTSIAAAWEVVDKLMADAFQVTVTVSHESGCCCFVQMGFTDAAEFEVSDAPTVPLAICRAALAAVSAPEPTTEGSEPA